MSKKYTKMHKNHRVADIGIDADGRLTGIYEIYDHKRFPTIYSSEEIALKSWWAHRSIPASRSGIDKALRALKLSDTQELLTKCLGLSLSDQYWVKPDGSELKWENVNFFDNDFSDDIGDVLFGSKPKSNTLDMMTPEGSSNGWLKKKWKIINGKRCLVKGGSCFFQEPFNEVIAYMIAKRLGIKCTKYSISYEGKNKVPVCICEDFVTRDTELIPAGTINSLLPHAKNGSKYQHFIKCCEKLGIPDVEKSLSEMIVLDYLIANQDRHMGNFGVLRNAETLEYLGLAPIYDSGTSLRYDTPAVYIDTKMDIEAQPFASFHSEQIKLVKELNSFDLNKLDGISNDIAVLFEDPRAEAYVPKDRQQKITEVVLQRIEMLSALQSRL